VLQAQEERYGEDLLMDSLQPRSCEQADGASVDRVISAIESASGESFEDDVAMLLISKADHPALVSTGAAQHEASLKGSAARVIQLQRGRLPAGGLDDVRASQDCPR
jgi:hypothetical protein